MPGMQEHIEILKLRGSLRFDILSAFAWVRFTCPYESLSDDIRPRLKTPEGGEPLRWTARAKIGFDDSECRDSELWTFTLHPRQKRGMLEARALFGVLHRGVKPNWDNAAGYVTHVLQVITRAEK